MHELDSHKLLDETRVREIRDLFRRSNASAFKRIIDKLDSDLVQFADALHKHVESAPVDDIKRMTHSLKGSSRTLGAEALGEMFVDLEILAGMGDIAAVNNCYIENQSLIEQSLHALRQFDIAP